MCDFRVAGLFVSFLGLCCAWLVLFVLSCCWVGVLLRLFWLVDVRVACFIVVCGCRSVLCL